MLVGWLSPLLRRTEENLWSLPVSSGQPRGLNGARASMRPISIQRNTRMTSAAKFLYTAF
jgi:leucyl aminopeptidase